MPIQNNFRKRYGRLAYREMPKRSWIQSGYVYMQSDSAIQCSEGNGVSEVTNFRRQFVVASITTKCKQRVDEIRGKWKIFCPFPFPCAFSFLILQYALRFPGREVGKKELVLPQIKIPNFLFFWSIPPLLGNSVRSISATLAILRCLLL